MKLENLTAIAPVDGRYRNKTSELAEFFSELGLIKYRILVEIEYLLALNNLELKGLPEINQEQKKKLQDIYLDFNIADGKRVKEIEKITNHDVKAVEYFVKEKLEKSGNKKVKEFVHFGLTSQDINNTATPLSLKNALNTVYLPHLKDLITRINTVSKAWESIPMLAKTHGQPASPTRLGKEMKVFTERLEIQLKQLKSLRFPAKFGGATGNFNAHHVAYPEIDWIAFADHFVNDILGLQRTRTTTQIEHYDNLAAIFDNLARINTILIDFSSDMWSYISMDYFKQKIKKGEIGSSAMPHKVNPIDFENAEGNLGLANALFQHLSKKLPISRLQRDLTDSTVLRNIGVPVGHTIIAFKALLKGLDKLIVNKEKINADLEENWTVVAEAIQTILRRENFENPYEALLKLTRTNKHISKEVIHQFIDSLDISIEVKKEMKKITPQNYTGI